MLVSIFEGEGGVWESVYLYTHLNVNNYGRPLKVSHKKCVFLFDLTVFKGNPCDSSMHCTIQVCLWLHVGHCKKVVTLQLANQLGDFVPVISCIFLHKTIYASLFVFTYMTWYLSKILNVLIC